MKSFTSLVCVCFLAFGFVFESNAEINCAETYGDWPAKFSLAT